jgi:hypothetical protein
MNDLITGVVCSAPQKAFAATEELTTNEHQWTPMKGVEISVYSCALVVRNLQSRPNSSPVFERETRDATKFFGVGSNQPQV